VALTKYNYNSFDLTTAASKGLGFNSSANGFETSAEGSMTLIKTLTASSDSTLSFVHGTSDVVLDSTYSVYLFKFINIHQSQTSFASFNVGFRDGGSAYDAIKTTTKFEVYQTEAASVSGPTYSSGDDLGNSTSFQRLGLPGYNNDESMVGEMFLFAPSNTTFTKHFISKTNGYYTGSNASWSEYVTGYINTTTAIDGVQFKMSGGNIDAGTVKLYGIADS
tara:strand:+ start:569 stop:1231 length:663 start_codon:yes stop_codon:yes gene_type:complete